MKENPGDSADMTSKKMMQAYVNANREAVAESENPHALITVLFDELIRCMRLHLPRVELGEHVENEHIENEHVENEHTKSEHIENKHIQNEHIQNEQIENEQIQNEHI